MSTSTTTPKPFIELPRFRFAPSCYCQPADYEWLHKPFRTGFVGHAYRIEENLDLTVTYYTRSKSMTNPLCDRYTPTTYTVNISGMFDSVFSNLPGSLSLSTLLPKENVTFTRHAVEFIVHALNHTYHFSVSDTRVEPDGIIRIRLNPIEIPNTHSSEFFEMIMDEKVYNELNLENFQFKCKHPVDLNSLPIVTVYDPTVNLEADFLTVLAARYNNRQPFVFKDLSQCLDFRLQNLTIFIPSSHSNVSQCYMATPVSIPFKDKPFSSSSQQDIPVKSPSKQDISIVPPLQPPTTDLKCPIPACRQNFSSGYDLGNHLFNHTELGKQRVKHMESAEALALLTQSSSSQESTSSSDVILLEDPRKRKSTSLPLIETQPYKQQR
jgi:hypothetical protein